MAVCSYCESVKKLTFLESLTRAATWHRRGLAALAVAVALFATLVALQPADAARVEVVAASHALAGGTVLSAADVTVSRHAPDQVPEGALTSVDQAIGRTLAAPVSARSVLTDATVATGRQLGRPGFVVLPLPVSDSAVASRLSAGSLIDILGMDAGKVTTLAGKVRVVAAPGPPSGGLTASATPVVLIEVTPEAALALTAALQSGSVTVALR